MCISPIKTTFGLDYFSSLIIIGHKNKEDDEKSYREQQTKKNKSVSKAFSKSTINQGIKKKRGAKPGAPITGIKEHREIIEKAFLEMYLKEYLEVAPTAGITTLAKFLFEKKLFLTKSNKPIATNTIRGELTDLLKDMNCTNPRGKQNKK